MRRVTLFVLAMIMAFFMTVAINPITAQAQTTDNTENLMATWSGDNLVYNGINLRRSETTPPSNNPFVPNVNGTACENSDHLYYSSTGTADSHPGEALISVICLDDSFDGSDKSQPINATFLLYRTPLNGRELSEIEVSDFSSGSMHDVTIAPEGTDALGRAASDTEPTTSCNSENTYGLGWIICPVTNCLAAGMDQLYAILSSFLMVAPLTNDTASVLYYMWGLVRSLANVLFIVGFMIIIYSHITSYGLSNYGIKRLLPRLIIAAILVNISYWIAALSVD